MGNLRSVLITGATGFLGGHLVRRLRGMDVNVLAVGRNTAKLAALESIGCDVLNHDISMPFSTDAGARCDAIVHCAALSAPFGKRASFIRANVDGTRHVLDLASRLGAHRFIHISTPSVYFSYCDQMHIAENALIPKPVNAYAETKRMAEILVQSQNTIDAIILRPRGIYGPDDTALLPRVLRAARARPLPLLRDGAAKIDLTFVDDVVDAILASLLANKAAIGEVFNISGGKVLPIHDIVQACCDQAGVTPRWRKMPLTPTLWAARGIEALAKLSPGGREPAITPYGLGLFAYAQSLDISKANRMLNWSPKVSFAQGLDATFEAQA